jgi:6-phosphogluconolactonase
MKRLLLTVLLLLSVAAPASAADYLFYAGTYTDGGSKGIYVWRFHSGDGSLTPLGLAAETAEPAHIWIAPDGNTLYAVNWVNPGTVSAYAIDHHSGKLALLNKVSAHGIHPNQVVVDPSGRVAVTVNYVSGSLAAYRIEPDGKLAPAFYTEADRGKPLSSQPGPEQHGIQFTHDSKFMFITDLGLDRIYSYRLDAARPSLAPLEPPYIKLPAGSGPRRMQLSADGKYLYVNHETDAKVEVFAVNGGRLTPLQTASTLAPGYEGENMTAEILLSADGRHLYVSNRGQDSITIFAVNPANGHVTQLKNVPAGKSPRNIRFSPGGDYLFSANQEGNSITEFKVDKKTGALTPTGVVLPISQPGGMYFTGAR